MGVLDWNWYVIEWIIVLLTIGVTLYYYGTKSHKRFKNVPHLKPLPFIGNMSKMIFKGQSFPHFELDMYNQLEGHQYGGFYMLNEPITLIRDPELIKTITVKDFDHFSDHRDVATKEMDPLWKKTLFSLKGQKWKDMRSTLSPAFTSSKMKTMFLLVSKCSEQLVNFLMDCQRKGNPSCNIKNENGILIVEVKDLLTRYANDVIATTAFGIGVDSLKEPDNIFFCMGQEGVKIGIWKFFLFQTAPKIGEWLGIKFIPKKVTTFFTSLIMEAMYAREHNGIVRPDMLHLLIQAKKGVLEDEDCTESTEKNKSQKARLTDEDILSQTRMFFLVGFDTTSTLLSFVMYLLGQHPVEQTKLHAEIDKVLEENGKFTYEAVHSMKYLDMVISETLRLYPSSPATDRLCNRQYTLKADPPFEFYPGDTLHIPIFGLHRDPTYFPDPDRFDPERFNNENKHKIKHMTYIPFGTGPRSCIGNRFALMEAKLALVYVLSKFRVKTVEKTPKTAKILQKGFVITIEGDFWLGLELRKS